MFWNLCSADVTSRKSILDITEDIGSKEDLLLYFVAIQQKNKSFPETHFSQEKSYDIYFNT